MALRIVYRPLARDDLKDIYDALEKAAGPEVAFGVVEAIEKRCETLSTFLERGTPRPEIGPGVRSIPFRRRATIAYRVDAEEISVIGIMYAGRDLAVLKEPGRQ